MCRAVVCSVCVEGSRKGKPRRMRMRGRGEGNERQRQEGVNRGKVVTTHHPILPIFSTFSTGSVPPGLGKGGRWWGRARRAGKLE